MKIYSIQFLDVDGMDPEQQNYYNNVKTKSKKDHNEYIKQHPEIRQVLNDYFSNVLLHKPDNVYSFTKDYFAFFNKKKEGAGLPVLLVMGPSSRGKEDVCRRLFEAFPHLFEESTLFTTKKVESGREEEGVVGVDREEFEQVGVGYARE